ncbi:hypothetical protein D9613_009522 [Agrocybe pediades]|uniref:Uncharacterized protein n=1 Tax=Agrocybe pediades TaxID=84607 RepID=A0A8H4VVN9_9AGAR|nr:hypothetical protein D9613_009522 [Agrocybe pediades]
MANIPGQDLITRCLDEYDTFLLEADKPINSREDNIGFIWTFSLHLQGTNSVIKWQILCEDDGEYTTWESVEQRYQKQIYWNGHVQIGVAILRTFKPQHREQTLNWIRGAMSTCFLGLKAKYTRRKEPLPAFPFLYWAPGVINTLQNLNVIKLDAPVQQLRPWTDSILRWLENARTKNPALMQGLPVWDIRSKDQHTLRDSN